MLKQKHVDASREVRLWFGQIIIPLTIGIMTLMSNQDVRNYLHIKAENAKRSFNEKLHRNK